MHGAGSAAALDEFGEIAEAFLGIAFARPRKIIVILPDSASLVLASAGEGFQGEGASAAATRPATAAVQGRLWVELSRSQPIGQLCVLSVRAAGSAPHFGEALCPPVGLSIGSISLALQDGALFGLQASLHRQISNVIGFGAPLTHRVGNADC
jgi:hypothetical protein